MGKPGAYEFSPLFAEGFHPLSLEDIRSRCVEPFPLSKTREDIFAGLEVVADFLITAGVTGRLLIDGSFTTHKIDPEDADVVLECDGDLFNTGKPSVKAAINRMIANLKKDLHCHTYVLFKYPPDHDLYTQWLWQYGWYIGQWGWCDTLEAKGIITFDIGGAVL